MAKAEFNIQEFAKKPFKYSESFCPEQSSGSVPVYCEPECAKFVVRFNKMTGNIIFAGCSEHWIALCLERGI